MAEQSAAPAAEGAGSGPTSLRFLQLKDAFRRMATVGTDCIDQQVWGPRYSMLVPQRNCARWLVATCRAMPCDWSAAPIAVRRHSTPRSLGWRPSYLGHCGKCTHR